MSVTTFIPLGTRQSAEISACGKYRYDLWRQWNDKKPFAMWIGLNPSTADANKDDQTIRRMVDFSTAFGYGGIVVANLFAFRATNPDELYHAIDPIGPENDRHICHLMALIDVGIVIACWGNHGYFMDRDVKISNMGKQLMCLGYTKDRNPRHPSRLSKSTQLEPFNLRRYGVIT